MFRVDKVIQWQPALEALDLRDDLRGEHAWRNVAGVVRADRDLGMRPTAGFRAAAAPAETRRACAPPSVPSSSAATMSASTCNGPRPALIRNCAAGRAVALELSKQRKVQDTFGVARPRQQADQNFRPRQEGIEAVLAVKGLHASECAASGVRLQPATLKPRRPS